MKKFRLGEFEEVVLLTVAVLYGEAYGVSIRHEIEAQTNRNVSVSALQTALRRMEKKGFLESNFGEATSVRGGKRKRFFHVTPFGKEALDNAKDSRLKLWSSIPSVAFDFGK